MADTDAAAADAGEGRRSSIEKKPIIIPGAGNGLDDINELPAFERLPDEIIQQYAPFFYVFFFFFFFFSFLVFSRALRVLMMVALVLT